MGSKGGSKFVKLSENELPAHSHVANAHKHYVTLSTSYDGYHSHHYRETFHSWKTFYEATIFTSLKDMHDYKEKQSEKTDYEGNHYHTVSGYTEMSPSQNVSFIGDSKPFDVRPPYFTVVYIIYLYN